MKIGSIGTSNITQMFLAAAVKTPGIEYTAAYSRSEARAREFAAENGAPFTFSDLNAMAMSDKIDAVYIASPNRFHYEQSRIFLENGKHVLCEKPLTTTLAEEKELLSLSAEKGVIYAEAIMSIHTPAFKVLKETMQTVGRIRTVNLIFCQLSSRYGAYTKGMLPNIFNPHLHAGCLMDIGVYNLYLAAALFGMPDGILSDAVFLESGADACGSAILRYKGFNVNLVYSKVGQNFAKSEIIGDLGTIQIGSVSQLTGITLLQNGNAVQLVPETLTRDEVMGGEAAFFRGAVEQGPNDDYRFAADISLTVREICDEIRKQNRFPF